MSYFDELIASSVLPTLQGVFATDGIYLPCHGAPFTVACLVSAVSGEQHDPSGRLIYVEHLNVTIGKADFAAAGGKLPRERDGFRRPEDPEDRPFSFVRIAEDWPSDWQLQFTRHRIEQVGLTNKQPV